MTAATGESASPRRATGLRLPALDGLRALAIIPVIAFHALLPSPGDLGVTLFFVLSGFLITGLLLTEHERTGAIDLRRFYLRRALRIFPAYYVFLAVAFPALHTLAMPVTPGSVLAAITYTWNYWAGVLNYNEGPVSPIWSLAIEEQFYLLWPLAITVALRSRRPLRFLGAFIVGVVLVRTALHLGFGIGRPYIYRAFETRADSLAVGCFLAIATRHGLAERWAPAVAARSWYPLVTLEFLTASWFAPPSYRLTIGYTIEAALLGVFMLQAMRLSSRPPWSWLNTRPLTFVGALSYSLYLWHRLGFTLGAALTGTQVQETRALGLALGVVFALGSYYVVERPGLALRDRLVRDVRLQAAKK